MIVPGNIYEVFRRFKNVVKEKTELAVADKKNSKRKTSIFYKTMQHHSTTTAKCSNRDMESKELLQYALYAVDQDCAGEPVRRQKVFVQPRQIEGNECGDCNMLFRWCVIVFFYFWFKKHF